MAETYLPPPEPSLASAAFIPAHPLCTGQPPAYPGLCVIGIVTDRKLDRSVELGQPVSKFLSIDRHNHDVVTFNPPVHAVHVQQSRCNKKRSRKRCMAYGRQVPAGQRHAAILW